MHRSYPWLAMMMAVLVPLLSACTVSNPPAAGATAQVSLPQAVEVYMGDLPGPSPKLFLTTRVYDRNGVLMGEFWDEGRRYWVSLSQIAPAVQQATIATEDKTFYTNPGIDWAAIVRAVVQNTGEGDVVSGASTITQQLARNIAMPFELRIQQSLDRKVSEAVLAQDLTERFTKDQVLEMYLNVVNYGHLAYGIEAAARTYFDKSAAQLTLAESTMLAGLPQAPATLDPLVPGNMDRAKARQGLVLALMARNGNIKTEEAQAAYAETLHFKSQQVPTNLAPHFMQYLREYLAQHYGKDMVARGGFTVYTSLDLHAQQKAEEIVKAQVTAVRDRYNLTNAALVAIVPHTGEILAMVGSADYNNAAIDGQVNVVTSLRQPGSAIKPVLYSLAFTRGLTPADLLWDIPVAYTSKYGQVYRPTNYDGRFHGPVRLRTALANSYNVPAVKLLNQMGIPDMVAMAHSLGITALNGPVENYGLAITLGGAEVTLLDLTGVFGVLANSGTPAQPTPIMRLLDSTGHEIKNSAEPARPALDPRVAYMVTSILSDNEARVPMFGTNSPLKLSRPAAAKTGTTTDWRDNWTVGYTPYLAVGVWAGNSNGQPMRNTTGLTGAAPIWHDFMEAVFTDPTLDRIVHAPGAPVDFVRPSGLVDVPICDLNAMRGQATCPSTKTDLFIDPTRPITIGLTVANTAAQPATAPGSSVAIATDAAVARPSPVPGPSVAIGTDAAVARPSPVSGSSLSLPIITSPAKPSPTPGSSRPPGAAGGVAASATARPQATPDPRPVDPAWMQVLCAPAQGGRTLAVIRLPVDAQERVAAQQWAAAVGLPYESSSCSATNLASAAAAAPGAAAPITSQAGIASPAPGAVIRGSVEVIGSAVFSTQQIQFYKVEYGSGSDPSTWITMGSGHPNPVGGGWLETWHADSLPNGPYALRVVLVKRDGNYVTSPVVTVQVAH